MAIEEILKRIIFIIRDHLSPDYQILLFGSWAKGNALNTSDIDIGILGGNVAPRSIMKYQLNLKIIFLIMIYYGSNIKQSYYDLREKIYNQIRLACQ